MLRRKNPDRRWRATEARPIDLPVASADDFLIGLCQFEERKPTHAHAVFVDSAGTVEQIQQRVRRHLLHVAGVAERCRRDFAETLERFRGDWRRLPAPREAAAAVPRTCSDVQPQWRGGNQTGIEIGTRVRRAKIFAEKIQCQWRTIAAKGIQRPAVTGNADVGKRFATREL